MLVMPSSAACFERREHRFENLGFVRFRDEPIDQ